MQQELADLSKILLYVGFPTLLAGAFVVLPYGNLLALELHPYVYVVVVAATITALFSPFAVLLAYAPDCDDRAADGRRLRPVRAPATAPP